MAWQTLAQEGATVAPWVRLLLLAGLLLIGVGLGLILRGGWRRAGGSRDGLEEQSRQIRGVHRDLEAIMVEIEQMAKRLGAQLDAKALRLESLLAQAQQTLETLEGRPSPRAPAGRASEMGTAPGSAAVSSPDGVTVPGQPVEDPLARSVYALADQGVSPQQIAQRLGEHAGKIELILALRHVR